MNRRLFQVQDRGQETLVAVPRIAEADVLGASSLSRESGPGLLKAVLAEIRPRQWAKNLLVFVPLLVSHRVFEPGLFWSASLAFLAWNFCASAAYVLNDLVDLHTDRIHPIKRARPFASRVLPTKLGPPLIAGLLLLAAVCVAASGKLMLIGTLVIYVCGAIAYSIWLKRVALADVMALAGLYALRVVSGGVATQIVLSEWLLAFIVFFFTSLALAKRYSELLRLSRNGQNECNGRGYRAGDIGLVENLGIGCGLTATVIFALYINSPQSRLLYTAHDLLWLVCPLLLYWNSRLWLVARRGDLREDPLLFALTDPVSRWLGALVVAVVLLASYGSAWRTTPLTMCNDTSFVCQRGDVAAECTLGACLHGC